MFHISPILSFTYSTALVSVEREREREDTLTRNKQFLLPKIQKQKFTLEILLFKPMKSKITSGIKNILSLIFIVTLIQLAINTALYTASLTYKVSTIIIIVVTRIIIVVTRTIIVVTRIINAVTRIINVVTRTILAATRTILAVTRTIVAVTRTIVVSTKVIVAVTRTTVVVTRTTVAATRAIVAATRVIVVNAFVRNVMFKIYNARAGIVLALA